MGRALTAMLIGASVAAMGIAGAGSARAAIVSITYTGTNAVGVDYEGLFGRAGASLSGDTASETFVFDTSKGQYSGGPNDAQVSYDPVFTPGYSQPLVSVSVTVDGKTFNLPVNDTIRSTYNELNDTGYPRVYTGYYYNDGLTATELGSTFWNPTVPSNLNQPYYSNSPGTGFPIPSGPNDSVVNIAIDDNLTTTKSTGTWLEFEPSTVQISVPEPGTWAMMLVGIAGLGTILRRQRKPRNDLNREVEYTGSNRASA